jgi:hypothetical protein
VREIGTADVLALGESLKMREFDKLVRSIVPHGPVPNTIALNQRQLLSLLAFALDADDLSLLHELGQREGARLHTKNRLAWANLERFGAVWIKPAKRGPWCTVAAMVDAREIARR